MNFLILHGSFVTPKDAWYAWIAQRLQSEWHTVYLPEFPIHKWDEVQNLPEGTRLTTQSLESWMKVVDPIIPKLRGTSLGIIAHSIGPVFALRIIEKYRLSVDLGIFLAPFFIIHDNSWQMQMVNSTFYKEDFDFPFLQKQIKKSYVIYSDNDPYVSNDESKRFGEKIRSTCVRVNKMRHMGLEENLTEFPLILDIIRKHQG